ncbi:hypothetical protein MMC13_007709 [Lambiella insularis]|nr:hypothetical protein [Lambiella insularis]
MLEGLTRRITSNEVNVIFDPRQSNDLADLESWLNPSAVGLPLHQFLESRESREIGSHKSLYEKESVATWLQADTGVLQITGASGYGKSVFAASVIAKVSQDVNFRSAVGYAFCMRLKLVTILRILIWQICRNQNITKEQKARIWEAYRDHRLRGGHGSPKEQEAKEILDLQEVYAQLLLRYDSVTLAFDGVDQCESPAILLECISLIASALLRFHKPLKLLFTSKESPRMSMRIKDKLKCYTLNLTPEDVQRCAERFVKYSLNCLEPRMKEEEEAQVLLASLAKAAEGTQKQSSSKREH